MDDLSGAIDDLRLDIETLHVLIDHSLDNGVGGEDIMLRACANLLNERRTRLEQLEQADAAADRP
jgi:hypothetical protein